MNLQSVESGHIDRIGHDPATKELRIRFSDGAEWKYLDVPRGKFNEMVKSKSVGGFFHKQIKGQFESEKVKGKGEKK